MSKGVVCGKGINDMEYGWRSENDWNYKVYQLWHSMLVRCYSDRYHETHQTYKNCYVCERWLILSNFVKDIVKIPNYNYWLSGFSEKRNPYQLDKDIKSDGQNKCYCLEQCMFVDYAENSKQAHKGKTLSEETKRKVSKAHKGKTLSEEHKRKIGESMKGKLVGENNPMYGRTGEKNPMYGKHHTEETRQKQSELMKGKFIGENHPRARKVVLVDEPTKKIVFTWQYKQQAIDFYSIGGSTLDYYLKGKAKKGHLYNGFLWYYEEDYKQVKESH